ncbi:Bro-N domain-containing protein (plasmid) [Clostridium botulinum]|uniref:BRO-N domain-containing protein n=1 Tax=Clostridium botulinum TaxID=1491 RepID=UPI00005DB4E6|nr:Bro-N domain-containing protein [Clostridium botulinum]YP_398454.1 hypothetical protein CST024 [Clostridium phage c-st]QPW54369.1 Bro-N domain-containing protein [Clostridium botulinum]BAE47722.1 conserved hypothetical protein [Clostridium phage c-st]
MTNSLMIFEGSELEILTKEDVNFEFEGTVLFNGKQVCEILEYNINNYAREITKYCDEENVYMVTKDKLVPLNDTSKEYVPITLGQRGTKFINEDGVWRMLNKSTKYSLIKKKEILKIFHEKSLLLNKTFENNAISSERSEIRFLEKIEESLVPFYIRGTKQYPILNFKIDYYIPKLNIAIEYDENDHSDYTYEQQEGRQRKIEKELGCKFIRVSDKNTDEYNIGFVIKNIIKIRGEELLV